MCLPKMKTRCSRLVESLVVAGLVTAAGCGHVAHDQADATAGKDGCDTLAEATRAYLQKCLPTQAFVTASTQRIAAECKMVDGARGVTGFGATLAACEAAYESAAETCATIDPAACLPPRGALLNGAPCGADAQCASGLCSVPAGGLVSSSPYETRGACGTCAPCVAACGLGLVCQQGTCVPLPPGELGENCVGHPCKNGLLCVNYTCAVPPAEGEACVDAFDPQGSVAVGCAAPFVCQRPIGLMGTCVRGNAEGGPCSPSGLACARGLQCDLPAGADPMDPTAGTCSSAPHIPAAGQPCDGAQVCEYGICASGKCPFPIPDGEACGADVRAPCNYFSQCIAGTCVLFDPNSCK
jgi:hypothetical protein